MKAYIDTNIILDVLFKRPGSYEAGVAILKLAENQQLQLLIHEAGIFQIIYFVQKELDLKASKALLANLLSSLNVVSGNKKIFLNALSSEFKDLEDAYHYFTANEHKCEVIITNNSKDFRTSTIPVMTAAHFLKHIAK